MVKLLGDLNPLERAIYNALAGQTRLTHAETLWVAVKAASVVGDDPLWRKHIAEFLAAEARQARAGGA